MFPTSALLKGPKSGNPISDCEEKKGGLARSIHPKCRAASGKVTGRPVEARPTAVERHPPKKGAPDGLNHIAFDLPCGEASRRADNTVRIIQPG
jgi:hypothetical protein